MNNITRLFLTFATASATVLTTTGCQAKYRAHADKVSNSYASGNYFAAAEIASEGAEKREEDESERVIYNLEAARTLQVAGDHEGSRNYYDAVYRDTRPYLDTEAEYTVSEGVATTAVNQAMRTYKATPPERIMCHTMNALNCLAMGDRDAARIELRLAQDWQEDAKNRYATEIEEAQLAAEKDEVAADIPETMSEHYANLEDLRGYSDFQNPFASHLRGVYLMSCGVDIDDRDGARFELRQVAATNPNVSAALTDDLTVLDNPLHTQPPTTWVYFMTGRAPHYEPLRIDVPIPVGDVPYVSAEFPQLTTNDDHMNGFSVKTTDGETPAYLLCNMDGVVASEFKVRLPAVIAQEVASSASKAAATYAAGEAFGGVGQLVGVIYQAGSTSADLRSWRTLPKHVYMTRIPTPQSGELSLTADEGDMDLGSVPVSAGQCNIVIVTTPSDQANASIQSIPMTGDIAAVWMTHAPQSFASVDTESQ